MTANASLLLKIFLTFFKIGCFTFGGGYAMIPLIEREMIENKGWIKKDEIIDILAVSQTVPGAVAINSATFIGQKVCGRKGALVATIGVILPSLIIITVIAAFFTRFQDNKIVKAFFMGIRSAVVALVALAAVKIGKASVKDKTGAIITVLTAGLVIVFDIHAVVAILAGAFSGLAIYKAFPSRARKIIEKGNDKD